MLTAHRIPDFQRKLWFRGDIDFNWDYNTHLTFKNRAKSDFSSFPKGVTHELHIANISLSFEVIMKT